MGRVGLLSSALSFRRIALVVAPLIAAAGIVAGVFIDPAIEESGRELARLLCLPLAVFGAWRAGLVAVWVPIVISAAVVVAQALQRFGLGLLILAAAMVALAYVFSKLDWRPRAQPA